MIALVSKVEAALPALTVTVFFVFVLLCETRQAINRYGQNGLTYMYERVSASKALRQTVADAASLVFHEDKSTFPHTVVVLEAVRESLGLSVSLLRNQKPQRVCTLKTLCVRLAALGICGKAALEGIPEWMVFAKAFIVVVCEMKNSKHTKNH